MHFLCSTIWQYKLNQTFIKQMEGQIGRNVLSPMADMVSIVESTYVELTNPEYSLSYEVLTSICNGKSDMFVVMK